MPRSSRILPSWRSLPASLLLACSPLGAEAMETPASALAEGIDQLRQTVGTWNVTTTQYRSDGTIARKVSGTWQFEWVVPDRVISGRSVIPALGEISGMLFYVNERRAALEFAQVDADGQLRVLSGGTGGELRTAGPVAAADGSSVQLRMKRFNVAADCFESRVEVSTDGGASWRPDQHQRFVRARGAGGGDAGLRYRKPSQTYVPLT
ncbi:MAG: hypothetical protein KF822_07955 [Steroidobacteraceae bacterium]|nr:hypothetical protein [Steroidobacteraceae bacterium]